MQYTKGTKAIMHNADTGCTCGCYINKLTQLGMDRISGSRSGICFPAGNKKKAFFRPYRSGYTRNIPRRNHYS